MIVSENEAKEKFCKVQPAAVIPQQGISGPTMAYAFAKCLGAQCAHWRWWSGSAGYCGLAGVPRPTEAEGNGAAH